MSIQDKGCFVVLGDLGVGKTALIKTYIEKKPSISHDPTTDDIFYVDAQI